MSYERLAFRRRDGRELKLTKTANDEDGTIPCPRVEHSPHRGRSQESEGNCKDDASSLARHVVPDVVASLVGF